MRLPPDLVRSGSHGKCWVPNTLSGCLSPESSSNSVLLAQPPASDVPYTGLLGVIVPAGIIVPAGVIVATVVGEARTMNLSRVNLNWLPSVTGCEKSGVAGDGHSTATDIRKDASDQNLSGNNWFAAKMATE